MRILFRGFQDPGRSIREERDILGRVLERERGGGQGGRSDNSDNKYAGFTNYGARRPAPMKKAARSESGGFRA